MGKPRITTTLSPTSSPVTSAERCDCFDIDIVCDPVERDDEICYFYRINRVSDNDYCLDPIKSIGISPGNNLDECGLTTNDFDDIVLDYAPKCYGLDKTKGLKVIFDDKPSSSKKKSDDDDDRRR